MAKGNPDIDAPVYPVGGRFDTVVQHVLGIEGGHVLDAVDHGGETKFGISLRWLKTAGQIDANHDGFADFDLDFDGDIDGADIRQLTRQEAANLYFRFFWQDTLPLFIDAAVFDQAVNGGRAAAVKMLQRAINLMQLTNDLVVDGQLGRQTLAAVWTIKRMNMANALLGRYRGQAEDRYRAIVRADPSQGRYLNGWVARARRLGDV